MKPKLHEFLQVFALSLLSFVLIVLILKELSAILQPLFVAIFLCYLAIPAYRGLRRLKVPDLLAKILVPLIFLLLLGAVGVITSLSFRILSEQFPLYRTRLETLFHARIGWISGLHPFLQGLLKEFSLPFDAIGKYLSHGIGSFFTFIGGIFVVLFYTIFIVLELRSFPKRFSQAYGAGKWREIQHLMSAISDRIITYVRVKTQVSLLATLPCALILFFFRVDLWFFWTILVFFGNFIPYVGSLVAFLFPILLFFLSTGNFAQTLLLTFLLVATKNVVEAFVEPKLAGRMLNLSPLLVVLAVTFWAWLWGIMGMFLSIPILVVIKTTLESISATKEIADLMGERSGP